MTDTNALHQAAIEAGATVLGDPPHYLMNADQIDAFLRLVGQPVTLPPCPVNIPPPPY